MTVIQICPAECSGQITLLLQNLQVQHDNCKNGEQPCQQVAEHEQHTDILQVKAQKGRIAAVVVNAVCHKLRSVSIGDTGPPAILHAQNGNQKDQITHHTDAKPGKAGIRRQMTPAKCDGQQLRRDNSHGSNPHQRLHCVGLRVLSAPDLYGLDAAALLPPLFEKINSVKHCQDNQRRYAVGYVFFQRNLHGFIFLSSCFRGSIAPPYQNTSPDTCPLSHNCRSLFLSFSFPHFLQQTLQEADPSQSTAAPP